ncbi:MAG: hypothetical protein U0229_01505 [Anaeromyxobacter sp.]
MDPAGLAAVATALAVAGLAVAWERYRRRQEARAWLESVRSVISGDPDAAIEALSDAARLRSPQAIDTYLALGQLFRREGDLSRALRLHRNMLHGPDLTPARRAEVERELAEDYRRSGMLAEAAEILRRLAPADPVAAAGLREVLHEGGDLTGAIEVQRASAGEGPDPILAHLLAARARQLAGSDPAGAAEAAARAVEAHPASADAWLATAELRGAGGDGAGALEAVGRALDAEPRAAPLAPPRWRRSRPRRRPRGSPPAAGAGRTTRASSCSRRGRWGGRGSRPGRSRRSARRSRPTATAAPCCPSGSSCRTRGPARPRAISPPVTRCSWTSSPGPSSRPAAGAARRPRPPGPSAAAPAAPMA